MTMRKWAWAVGVLVAGVAIGGAVAVASSPSSLNPDRHQSSGVQLPTPSPVASPSPTVTTRGILGVSPRLLTNGSSTLIALGANLTIVSADGGRTWTTIQPPANGVGIAVDPSNPRHAITGGYPIQVTENAGAAWTPQLSAPPGKGPYEPLGISPIEPNTWLFEHQGRLLITHDGSSTWSDLSGLPSLASPVVAFGQAVGQFFIGIGNRVFALSSYGQNVTEEPSLTQGAPSELAVAGGNRLTILARVPGHGVFVFDGAGWTPAGAAFGGPVAGGSGGTMLIGNGGDKLGTPGLVVYSTSAKGPWLQATGLPPDQTVEALAGLPASATFFAYSEGGDIYSSTDGGRDWTLVTRALRSPSG